MGLAQGRARTLTHESRASGVSAGERSGTPGCSQTRTLAGPVCPGECTHQFVRVPQNHGLDGNPWDERTCGQRRDTSHLHGGTSPACAARGGGGGLSTEWASQSEVTRGRLWTLRPNPRVAGDRYENTSGLRHSAGSEGLPHLLTDRDN